EHYPFPEPRRLICIELTLWSLKPCRPSSSVISSPTLGIPVFMPKSERLNLAVASPPHFSLLLPLAGLHLKRAIVSVSGLVTPSSVRSPSIELGLSPLKLILVAL